MSKEDKETAVVEEAEAEVDHQAELSAVIKKVISSACKRPGGLRLPIGMRTSEKGHKQVSEEMAFGPGSLQDVVVRADFTFVLVLSGARYWLQSRSSNCSVVQQIRSYTRNPRAFAFPPGVAFSTSQ